MTAIDRDKLREMLVRFWGTDKVRRVTVGVDQVPIAEVMCLDMWDVNAAVLELLGMTGDLGIQRVELDRDGATVFRAGEKTPRWVPFDDQLSLQGPWVK